MARHVGEKHRMPDKRFYALLVWSTIMAVFVMGTVLAILGKG